MPLSSHEEEVPAHREKGVEKWIQRELPEIPILDAVQAYAGSGGGVGFGAALETGRGSHEQKREGRWIDSSKSGIRSAGQLGGGEVRSASST